MNKKILGLLCIIFILLSGVFYLQSEESKNEYKDQNVVISEDNEAEEVTSEKADTSVDEIAVYICGAVRHPGVYYFKEGSRINDAVRAAGGFKKKAAKTEVNLAENRISNESPIGRALLGAKKGATVDVDAPAGIMQYKILSIKK